MSRPSVTGRLLFRVVVFSVVATGVVAGGASAEAHVTVHPAMVAAGDSDGVLTFRVPDEEATAATTELQILLPPDDPIASVLVAPALGWTVKVTTRHLATPIVTDDGSIGQVVSEIAWTGGRIQPGQYQDFDVSYGRLPTTPGALTFKALQTYSDGDVVRWIDVTRSGQPEPAHPAPVVRLTPSADPSPAARRADPARPATTSRPVAVTALIVAVVALIGTGFGLIRSRQP